MIRLRSLSAQFEYSPEVISKVFAQKTSYHFRRPELLLIALTHSSCNGICPDKVSNERLEFLGDAVLELEISHRLYELFPDANEGELSRKRAFLVSRKHLAKVCSRMNFEDLMFTGFSGESHLRLLSRTSVLANLLEALIGAIYLDSGLEEVRRFILNSSIFEPQNKNKILDPKGALQELVQKFGFQPPKYLLLSKEGPDHEALFWVEVEVNGSILSKGSGPSKKAAQVAAANKSLEILQKELAQKKVSD